MAIAPSDRETAAMQERMLRELEAINRSLRGAQAIGDRRLWAPDETCLPVNLFTCGPFGNGQTVFEFLVAAEHRLVLTHYSGFNSAGSSAKDAANIRIRRGIVEGAGGTAVDQNGIPLNGAISRVREISTAGANVTGLPISNQPLVLPIRVILEPGPYTVFQGGTGAGLGAASIVYFHGYSFPMNPKTRA